MFYPSCAAIFRNVYYAEIMEALEATLEEKGYDLLLSGYDSSITSDEPPRFVRQGKVDGIILLGGFPRKIVRSLQAYGIPLLHLDSYRKVIKIDFVTTDGYGASRQIVDHLVQLGHRRILFMAHSHEDTNADQRELGFLKAVADHKLPKTLSVSLRDFTCTADGYPLLKHLMESKRPPTAVICVNDTLAEQLIRCLQDDGFKVPGDITVFGFNDDLDSQRSTPTISTVRVDKSELGRLGAQTILDRIAKPDAPVIAATLPVELVHRQSEAPPKS